MNEIFLKYLKNILEWAITLATIKGASLISISFNLPNYLFYKHMA